jgi:LPPG:FO 2-phospho-L-lactate transferase
MIVLSGGTGTPKLLVGLKEIVSDFCVVVNTAEDVWVSGNKICPDIDSVIYALAGVIDDMKWWGIKNDTFTTHFQLRSLGYDEVMMIGDRDRATHILRSEMLRKGMTLRDATKVVARAYGVETEIYPMCEEEVSTIVVTDDGEMHFQEFWVRRKGEPDVVDVYFKNIENAKIYDELKKALKMHDEVLIGPSNPITSIMPILNVENFSEMLVDKKVVAVSPIIGTQPFSGPAGKLMKAKGYEVSPKGVFEVYKNFLDVLVVDEKDEKLRSQRYVPAKTIMRGEEDAMRLAEFIIKLFDQL